MNLCGVTIIVLVVYSNNVGIIGNLIGGNVLSIVHQDVTAAYVD